MDSNKALDILYDAIDGEGDYDDVITAIKLGAEIIHNTKLTLNYMNKEVPEENVLRVLNDPAQPWTNSEFMAAIWAAINAIEYREEHILEK